MLAGRLRLCDRAGDAGAVPVAECEAALDLIYDGRNGRGAGVVENEIVVGQVELALPVAGGAGKHKRIDAAGVGGASAGGDREHAINVQRVFVNEGACDAGPATDE